MGLGGFAGPQQLRMAGHCRHDRSAGIGIGVFQNHSVIGAAVGHRGQALQRRPCLVPRIVHQRRMSTLRFFPGGTQHAGAVGGQGRIGGKGDWLDVLGIGLEEYGLQQVGQRQVQTVQPDHGVAGGVAVVVPGPVGGQHQISGKHGYLVAFDGGMAAVAFDDES